jgi:hypothetical protein
MRRNDEQAKKTLTGILDSFGWETADMRDIQGSRMLKPLAMLWIVNRKNWYGYTIRVTDGSDTKSASCAVLSRTYGGHTACSYM